MKLDRIVGVWIFALASLPAFGAMCTISANGMDLGIYTPNQALPVDSAGRITINCTKGALDTMPMSIPYTLELSRGGSPGFSPREMSSGGNRLRYNFYTDSQRLSIWGDGSGGTSAVNGSLQLQPSPGTASMSHSIYGRIFASQNAVPGGYADAVIVTVTY